MARPKKDPSTAVASYNIKNVERAIGYTTASIDNGQSHHKSLTSATERYALSSLEAAMVYMETVQLIAPQFRDGQNLSSSVVNYTLTEIEARKVEVKTAVEGAKQRRTAAKQ